MDVNGSNTGGCRLGSAYLVCDLVAGFCENSSGRLFCIEETVNFLTNSAITRLTRRLYYMQLFNVLKSDSFHILSVC
jgi:hypothetical protein